MNSFSTLVRTGLFCLAAAAIPFSTGCGMDVGVSGSTGSGGTTGSGGGCSNGVTSGGTGGVEPTGAGGAQMTTSVSTGVGGGAFCGGIAGIPCAADEFCDFADNSCGNADGGGTCQKRPMVCDASYSPTCGCDGQIYGSACTASGAGHDVAPAGTCTPPVGMFSCGEHFCDLKTQYCQKQLSDIGGEPHSYVCIQQPAGCGASPSCPCLVNEPCSDACSMQNGGGLQLTCPGG